MEIMSDEKLKIDNGKLSAVNYQLKNGYKQTDIGIIPIDWEIVEFGSIVDYTKGYPFKSKDYKDDGIRVIRVSDTTFNAIKEQSPIFIDINEVRIYNKWSLKEFDLIISTVGSKPPMYDSMVGKVIIINKKFEGCLLNQNAVLIRSKDKDSYIQYLLYSHFKTEKYYNYIETIICGNANQGSITLKELFKFKIPIPILKEERRAISNALSDVDALINSLDALIVKKRNIKQGAMQQLLTGEKRLQGFTESWKITTFGEVMIGCSSGSTPSRGVAEYYTGDIKWITSGELNYNVIFDTKEKITKEAVKNTNLKLLPKGTFLMAITGLEAEGTRGSCGVTGVEATTNQSCMALFPSNELLNEYLFHYYVFLGKRFALQYCQGTKQQSYTAKLVKILPFKLPPTTIEQRAITEILGDIDAEIKSLLQQRDKAKLIKEGMMQELLTGKTRLI